MDSTPEQVKNLLADLTNPDAPEDRRAEAAEKLIEAPAKWAALRATDDPDLIDEYTQAARVKIFTAIYEGKFSYFKSEHAFFLWATTIAVNAITNEARNGVGGYNGEVVYFDDLAPEEELADDIFGEDSILDFVDRERFLERGLEAAHLSKRQRLILDCYYDLDRQGAMTDQEIADKMRVDRSTVTKLRQRAEAKLRMTLRRLEEV